MSVLSAILAKEYIAIKKQPSRIFLHTAVITALILNFYFIHIHELYRDEAQAWLIARDTGPFSIFNVLSYEGHPFLWFYLLMPFAKLGFPYPVIKVISMVLMDSAMLITAYLSPFTIPVRISFVLSALFVYRYACFGRSYSLAALVIVIICYLYKYRHSKPFPYLTAVAVMIQTHLLTLGFGFGLCLMFLLEELTGLPKSGAGAKAYVRRLSPLLIPFFSALFYLVEFRNVLSATVMSRSVYLLVPKYFLAYGQAFGLLVQRFLGIPGTALQELFQELAPVFLTVLILHSVIILIFFRNCLKEFLVLSAGLIWSFAVFSLSVGAADYRVHLCSYMIFWYLWSLEEMLVHNGGPFYGSPETDAVRKRRLFLTVNTALAAALIVGTSYTFYYKSKGGSAYRDIRRVYSDSENTAAFIDTLPEDAVILENAEDFCNSVIPWLQRQTVIDPFTNEPASYVKRDRERQDSMTCEEFMEYCRTEFADKDEIYLLYCEVQSNITDFNSDEYETLYKTVDRVSSSESYRVLRIPLDRQE